MKQVKCLLYYQLLVSSFIEENNTHKIYAAPKKNADLDIYLLLAIKSGSIRTIIKIEISVSKFLWINKLTFKNKNNPTENATEM